MLLFAHETIFRELIPLLEDGQVIHIFPDNCGTFVMRKLMREMNCTKKVIVGAWYTAPYGIRVVNRGGVDTPVIDSMILLASIMIKRDLAAESKYTLDYLEIGHMTHEQLQKYLREGEFTAK